jgi:hypothetical protein
MTIADMRRTGIAAVIFVAMMAIAAWLQQVRDRRYPLPVIEDTSLYLTSAKSVGRMALEYDALAADLYWIRTLQYFGGTKRMVAAGETIADPARREYAALYPLLDLTTSLDPRFNLAYRFGAFFLAEPPPGGPGRPDLAVALLEKGVRARPDKWEYLHDIGFVHYWWRHDYKAASEWFQRASEIPGAPWWLKSLAASTLAQGGDRQSSRMMWEAIRQAAEIDWLRHDAERRLAQLKALDELDALQQIVNRVASLSPQPVLDWRPVIRAMNWRGTPADPSGTPYEIDETGRVRVAQSSPLWPLPEEPRRLDPAPPS